MFSLSRQSRLSYQLLDVPSSQSKESYVYIFLISEIDEIFMFYIEVCYVLPLKKNTLNSLFFAWLIL